MVDPAIKPHEFIVIDVAKANQSMLLSTPYMNRTYSHKRQAVGGVGFELVMTCAAYKPPSKASPTLY